MPPMTIGTRRMRTLSKTQATISTAGSIAVEVFPPVLTRKTKARQTIITPTRRDQTFMTKRPKSAMTTMATAASFLCRK